MTTNETFVLMLALNAGHRLRYRDVTSAMPGEPWRLLNNLRKQGVLAHLRYDHWQITEKGRLAAAMAMHKDPKLARAFSLETA